MVLTTAALLAGAPRPADGAIDAALAGQICRCGSYPRIRRAVHRAAGLAVQSDAGPPAVQSDALAGNPEARPPAEPPDADRWGPPLPGGPQFRPARPWDLTDLADRDWFAVLGDGLVVVLDPPPADPGTWSTARSAWLHVGALGRGAFTGKVDRPGQQDSAPPARRRGLGAAWQVRLMGDASVPYDGAPTAAVDAGQKRGAATAAYARSCPSGQVSVVSRGRGARAVGPGRWRLAGHPHLPPGTVAAVTGARRFVPISGSQGCGTASCCIPAPGAVRSLGTSALVSGTTCS
jgi:hypothetical protein